MRLLKRAACFGSLVLQLSGFPCLAQVLPERQPADPKTFTIPPLGKILPHFREAPTDAFSKMRRQLGGLGHFDAIRPTTEPHVILINSPKVCAAPLLEAPIPSANAFRMPQLRPARDVAPMAEAKVPAPACAKDSQ